MNILVTCLTDKEQVILCLHKAEPQLHPVSILENEERILLIQSGGGQEISGHLPSLTFPAQQAGGTWKKYPNNYFILLMVWIGQWLVKMCGLGSPGVEGAV